jgi:hypothetical protein
LTAITFTAAWQKGDGNLETDAKAFWLRQKTILPRNVSADDRARELCAVAYRDGSPVGVSTATLEYIPRFRSRMALYRCAVETGLRHQPLSWRITEFSGEVLETWSVAHPEEKVMGLMAIIQSKELIMRYPQVFAPANMLFTGFSAAGFPIRVAWFKHATIPIEWPPRPLAVDR